MLRQGVNGLVTSIASGNSPFRSWPFPPPTSGNPCADCMGIIVDAAELALWLSPHILRNVQRVLEDLFKWERPQADAYLAVIAEAAEHSGGGLLADVPRTVHDCSDYEDNLVLDLAAEVGAMRDEGAAEAAIRHGIRRTSAAGAPLGFIQWG